MKNIFRLIVACLFITLTHLVHGDDILATAIRLSDKAAVSRNLMQNIDQKSYYVDVAQEVLELRRKDLEQGTLLCQFHLSPTASYVPGTWHYYVGMLCSGLGVAAGHYGRYYYYENKILVYLSSLVSLVAFKKNV